jgi:hypothetical protein
VNIKHQQLRFAIATFLSFFSLSLYLSLSLSCVYVSVKKDSQNETKCEFVGTVGEPINPAAWEWYYHVVGEGRCAIVDTYWQTETVHITHITSLSLLFSPSPFQIISNVCVNVDRAEL